eukprot:CAMPEP_0201881940 /NCGR_PEP_ID=MMETSP0902-20130614/12700_1 /ASSEMBLY_ACC=CAM_ASM_000551 /TAXON_ID=420261 /ORGANISM="Thalassiosira antarctica, Strain CCMP982" /LENGTH=77 /DNA_ID=CAMNT_0048410257 /DNA_START=76 /DNA_END=305 /DNA_ORIENTATION=+
MHLGQVGEGVEGEGKYSTGDVVGDGVSAGRTRRGVGDSVLTTPTVSVSPDVDNIVGFRVGGRDDGIGVGGADDGIGV